jgi:hypothetical protein
MRPFKFLSSDGCGLQNYCEQWLAESGRRIVLLEVIIVTDYTTLL